MFKVMIRRVGFYLAASSLFMVLMLLVFTAFYHWVEHLGWLDSLYFTVVTTRTIGFGDIHPLTEAGKIGTILNALVPATVFLGTSLVVLETGMRQLEELWRKHQMKRNAGHDIIVCDTDTLESILNEYVAAKRNFVVVSREKLDDVTPGLQVSLDHGNFLHGDAARDDVLEKAGVGKARNIIIATGDDSFNMYVLVTAKNLNPRLSKVVRINNVENASKFASVGADRVLPSSSIIGQMMADASFHPFAHDFLVSLLTHKQDPFLEDAVAREEDVGGKIRERFRGAVAVFREGRFVFDLDDETIREGDVIVKMHFKYE